MTTSNVAGNYYDKYHTRNPIAQWLMNGFYRAFDDLVARSAAKTAYEAGCGEGHLSIRLANHGLEIAGSDVDSEIVQRAIENVRAAGAHGEFRVCNLYDLTTNVVGNRDLVICCEVLEHVDEPERALDVIAKINSKHVILSVPREPIWRILNMARGQYLLSLGNTPGHLQHWRSRRFLDFLQRRFDVVAIRRPLPWTMALCKPRIVNS